MRSGADLHRGRACPKLQNFQKKKKLKLEFYPLRLVFFFFFSLFNLAPPFLQAWSATTEFWAGMEEESGRLQVEAILYYLKYNYIYSQDTKAGKALDLKKKRERLKALSRYST
jgi:hypothetical protein